MPMPAYATEQDFRQQWVAPFLSRMGFILPKHVHGHDEQGKDFFFAEHDRFGHLRILIAQVKLGNIGTGREVSSLWDQVQRSFEVTLKYHKGMHDQRVSGVYIMATGTISSDAREQIWDQSRLKRYGENVYFLDGETLDNLNRSISFRDDREIRERLVGLADELAFNSQILDRLMEAHRMGSQGFKSFVTVCLEDSLKAFPDPAAIGILRTLWLLLANISRRMQPLPGVELFEQQDFDSWQSTTDQASTAIVRARTITAESLKQLDARWSLELEVVPMLQEKV